MFSAEVLDHRAGPHGTEVYVILASAGTVDPVGGFWLPETDATVLIRQLALGVELVQSARDFVTVALAAGRFDLSMLDSAPVGTEVTNRYGVTAIKLVDAYCGESWHIEGEHELDRHPSNWMINEFHNHQTAGVRR